MANIHVKKFNKIIIGFLDELMKILPEEKNIKVFKSQLSTVEYLDEKKIIKVLFNMVIHIRNRF